MSISGYFRLRKVRKNADELLRHADHVRDMRGDLLGENVLGDVAAARAALRTAQRGADATAIEAAGETLYTLLVKLTPPRSLRGVRENVEIIVVAIAVAMGVRTYFIQPFKIPTGSMQPTLYGITAEDRTVAGVTDRLPLKLVKWLVTGEWYREVRVEAGGHLSAPMDGSPVYPSDKYYEVAGRRYRVPSRTQLRYNPGDYVPAGTVLWAGVRLAGDHVFVDRVRWNFARPKRGEVMVFTTDGIPTLPAGTHYIKRMVGVPNEKISITPPQLLVGGVPCLKPDSIRRIAERQGTYAGYQLVPAYEGGLLTRSDSVIATREREYVAMGDNTQNSRDGRYWGIVPARNLVGPAVFVYWPFTRHSKALGWFGRFGVIH